MKKYWRVFNLILDLDPVSLVISFVYTLSTILKPVVVLFASGQIVNGIISNQSIESINGVTFKLLGIIALIHLVSIVFEKLNTDHANIVYYKLQRKLIEKSLVMEYASLESPENRLNFKKAEEGSTYSGGIFTFIQNSVSVLLDLVLSLVIAGASIVYLATTKTAQSSSLAQFANSPLFSVLMILLLLLPLLITYKTNKISNEINLKSFEDIAYVNREMGYYWSTLLFDVSPGKTIRMYNSSPMILDVLYEGTNFFLKKTKKNWNYINNIRGISQIFTALCTGFLFSMLAIKAYTQAIAVGDIVVLGGALQLIVSSLVNNLGKVTAIDNQINFFQFYIDYLALPEVRIDETVKPSDTMEIEFRNVSFKYPGSDTKVLDGVSFKIHHGERISVVGRNGAGKTTLVKLLTRLYQPTEGEILMNGVNILDLSISEVMTNLSIVFQDFALYPFTVKENIVSNYSVNEDRIEAALETTDMSQKIRNLDRGLDSVLKAEYNDGISFSGGEAQKIAISRAWYKDSPMIILDEPTAALDPMSEFEIYSHFNDLIENRTAIYISHRMSSSRFSDRIIVFDKGRVIEEGNHSALMRIEAGIYRQLFETQAEYYMS